MESPKVLKVLMGSKRWGLDNSQSDEDWIYLVKDNPNELLLGNKSQSSFDGNDTTYGVLSFHNLLLKGNPNIFSIINSRERSNDSLFQIYLDAAYDITNSNLGFYWSQVLKANIGRIRRELNREDSNKKTLNILYYLVQSNEIIQFLYTKDESNLFWCIRNSVPSELAQHYSELISLKQSDELYTKWDYSEAVQELLKGDYFTILVNKLDNKSKEKLNKYYLQYVLRGIDNE